MQLKIGDEVRIIWPYYTSDVGRFCVDMKISGAIGKIIEINYYELSIKIQLTDKRFKYMGSIIIRPEFVEGLTFKDYIYLASIKNENR